MDDNKFLNDILDHYNQAEEAKQVNVIQWEDEHKCYIGEQDSLSFMGRKRSNRANSIDNMIFPAVEYKKYILTSNTPDTAVIVLSDEPGRYDELDERSQLLTYTVNDITYKNNYALIWDRVILQGLKHGPLIMGVNWDGDWKGGVGENRWVGECRLNYIEKEQFYPDPSVIDLEQNLQECQFIVEKQRKNLKWFKDKYPNKYSKIKTVDDRGNKIKEADLYLYFHKGKPKTVPGEWRTIWKDRIEETEDPLEKRKYESYLAKETNGIHLAICSDNVVLEYLPYIYEDGMYPYAYKVIHVDDENQWGFGEIKNMIQPQILMNKVDSIEAEAYSRQGLGGYHLQKGAANAQQKKALAENAYKGGVILEFDNLGGVEERQPVKVPSTIQEYKLYKKQIASEIVGYTNIQQGMAKSGTPFKAIQELGARADVRTIGIIKKAEMFHREIVELILSRINEFYKVNRKITVREGMTPYQMTYTPQILLQQWDREVDGEEVMETYMPEHTVRVNIVDAKPTDREYYINLANMLFDRQLIDMDSYLEAIETGKMPPKEIIKERLQAQMQPEPEPPLTTQGLMEQIQ